MRLVRWAPMVGLDTLHNEMEDFFRNFMLTERRRDDVESRDWTPRVNILEYDDRFELTADLPGIDKKDINIEVQDDILTIRGEKNIEKQENTECCHVFERRSGKYVRSFRLPENVNADALDAEYKDGVLKINIPVVEKPKPKEIKVKVK